MIRFLVILFVSGLLVCATCLSIAAGMGWPKNFTFGPVNWDSSSDDDKGPIRNLGAPGPITSREFAWDGDDTLKLKVPAQVIYTQGPDARVVITGPQNWISEMEVRDGEIGLVDGRYRLRSGNTDATIRIEVTAPSVNTFELNGAQDMKILAYDQDSFDLEVNGAANIRAAGRARKMDIQVNGAANVNLADLVNDDAEVQLNGAGNVVLSPTVSSDVEINGLGSAKLLTRPPTTHQQVHGLGSVQYGMSRKDAEVEEQTTAAQPATPAQPAQPAKPSPPATPAQPAPKAKTTAA